MNEVVKHSVSTEPNIGFSKSALEHITRYLRDNDQYKGVRLSVKKTGCSGYSYVVDYVTEPLESDYTQSLADGYKVYIDKNSLPYLKNMQIDYEKQGLNQKLVFHNPNQTGQCGCGESFTVDH